MGKTYSHDPSEHVRGLQQLLISDKKQIAFLFGAGTSLAKKCKTSISVPAIGQLTAIIEKELSKDTLVKAAISEIKTEIGSTKYQIETLLSNLEQKYQVIGKGRLNGLDKDRLASLITNVKKLIRTHVSVHKKAPEPDKTEPDKTEPDKTELDKTELDKTELDKTELDKIIHCDFAEWIGRVDRKFPIEIFTTNYDYLFEIGLENRNVPFYDGFTGSYLPFFNSDSIEDFCFLPNQPKLWKLHGSLGWHYDEASRKVIRKDSSEEDILIYPSTLKYSDSKKQPYISLLDRLSSFLKRDDTILITCGYSFNDEHINERIRTALNSNACTHVIALYHDVKTNDGKREYTFTVDCELAKMAKSTNKMSVYSRRAGIIGCHYGNWRLRREPEKTDAINLSCYFDEDASIGIQELKKEAKGDEFWTGEGELKITDFVDFVYFLKSMMVDETQHIRILNAK
jgi:hypothetical protein